MHWLNQKIVFKYILVLLFHKFSKYMKVSDFAGHTKLPCWLYAGKPWSKECKRLTLDNFKSQLIAKAEVFLEEHWNQTKHIIPSWFIVSWDHETIRWVCINYSHLNKGYLLHISTHVSTNHIHVIKSMRC